MQGDGEARTDPDDKGTEATWCSTRGANATWTVRLQEQDVSLCVAFATVLEALQKRFEAHLQEQKLLQKKPEMNTTSYMNSETRRCGKPTGRKHSSIS